MQDEFFYSIYGKVNNETIFAIFCDYDDELVTSILQKIKLRYNKLRLVQHEEVRQLTDFDNLALVDRKEVQEGAKVTNTIADNWLKDHPEKESFIAGAMEYLSNNRKINIFISALNFKEGKNDDEFVEYVSQVSV